MKNKTRANIYCSISYKTSKVYVIFSELVMCGILGYASNEVIT